MSQAATSDAAAPSAVDADDDASSTDADIRSPAECADELSSDAAGSTSSSLQATQTEAEPDGSPGADLEGDGDTEDIGATAPASAWTDDVSSAGPTSDGASGDDASGKDSGGGPVEAVSPAPGMVVTDAEVPERAYVAEVQNGITSRQDAVEDDTAVMHGPADESHDFAAVDHSADEDGAADHGCGTADRDRTVPIRLTDDDATTVIAVSTTAEPYAAQAADISTDLPQADHTSVIPAVGSARVVTGPATTEDTSASPARGTSPVRPRADDTSVIPAVAPPTTGPQGRTTSPVKGAATSATGSAAVRPPEQEIEGFAGGWAAAVGSAAVRPPAEPVTTPAASGAAAVGGAATGVPHVTEPDQTTPIRSAPEAYAAAPEAYADAPGEIAAPARKPKRRRRRRTAVLSVVAVLVVLVAAVLVMRPGPVAGWFAEPVPTVARPEPSPEPAPAPVLLPAAADQSGPTPAGVRTAVEALVTNSGLAGALDVSIVDVQTNAVLYAVAPDDRRTPASTTKLVTAAAALAARGTTYRIPTRVVAGAQPGEVVLVGGGDPTLAADDRASYPGSARLDELAGQVRKALGGVVPMKVVFDGSLFSGPTLGPGWDPDIVATGNAAQMTALMVNGGRARPELSPEHHEDRVAKPDQTAAQAFAKSLGVDRKTIVAGKAPELAVPVSDAGTAGVSAAPTPPAPPAGTELGRVESPPMLRLVEFMLQNSDNVIAEALARQVALARGQPASFAGAAAAVDAVVAELGLPADESELKDGSGLSRDNRVTPSLLTDLLATAANGTRPELSALFAGLPVAGWSGTLEDRFDEQDPNRIGRGVIRAKTGSLQKVNALSGVVATASGHLLAFAFLSEGDNTSWMARPKLDAIAAKLAACGCT